MAGIQETKDVMVALADLATIVIKAARGGGTVADVAERVKQAVQACPALVQDLKAAVDGATDVPAELKDLSFAEGIELGGAGLDLARRVVAALQTN